MSPKSAKIVGSKPPAAAEARVAVRVVALALLGVAEDAVGLRRLLEALLGLLVARVAVGVVLERQLAVGGLDLLLGGVPGDPEDLVVVALGHQAAGRSATGGVQRACEDGSLRPLHGRSMAWPMRLAAFSISARRAFSSSRLAVGASPSWPAPWRRGCAPARRR